MQNYLRFSPVLVQKSWYQIIKFDLKTTLGIHNMLFLWFLMEVFFRQSSDAKLVATLNLFFI